MLECPFFNESIPERYQTQVVWNEMEKYWALGKEIKFRDSEIMLALLSIPKILT